MNGEAVGQWVLDTWATWLQTDVSVVIAGSRWVGRGTGVRTPLEPLPWIFDRVLGHPDPLWTAVSGSGGWGPTTEPPAVTDLPADAMRGALDKPWGSIPEFLHASLAVADRWLTGWGVRVGPQSTALVAAPTYLRRSLAWRLAERNGQAQIVRAGFSGIQRYVFGALRIGTAHQAKALRARSGRLSAWSLGTAQDLIRWVQGDPVQVLWEGAGRWEAVVPPSVDVAQWAASYERAVWDRTHGQVQWHWVAVPVSEAAWIDGDPKWEAHLARAWREVTERPGHRIWVQNGQWQTDAALWRSARGRERCARCRQHPAETENQLCADCAEDTRVGARLPRTRWVRLRSDQDGVFALAPRVSWDLSVEPPAAPETGWWPVATASEMPTAVRVGWQTYIPRATAPCPHCLADPDWPPEDRVGPGDPYTFMCLAALDQPERPRLGFLKVDGDRVGQRWVTGARQAPAAARGAWSQELSAALTQFFSQGWRTEGVDQLYTVFAGGDDVYLIGGAQTILRAAGALHEAFTRYTGRRDWTISAGLIIADPHTPLAWATEAVRAALDRAKTQPSLERQAQGHQDGRDQIALGSTVFTWPAFQAFLAEVDQVAGWVTRQWLSKSLLYRLQAAAEVAAADSEAWGWWDARLAAVLRRHLVSPEQTPVRAWLETYRIETHPDAAMRLTRWPLLVSLVTGWRGAVM